MIERGIEFVIGSLFVVLGLTVDSISLQVFFFIMAAMFYLSIFRPAKLV